MGALIDPDKLNPNVDVVSKYADLGEMFMFYMLMFTKDSTPLFPGLYGPVRIRARGVKGVHTGYNNTANICGYGFTGDNRFWLGGNVTTIPIMAAYGGPEFQLFNLNSGEPLLAQDVGNMLTFNGVTATA